MTQEVEEMTSTSIKLTLIAAILVTGFVSSVSADFYYNQGPGLSGISNDSYLSMPGYTNHKEIATELVAPFIFVTVLLHFALSRALSFILANDSDDPIRDNLVRWGLPRGVETYDDSRVDVSKYSMIMSITIAASLVPTPYWSLIRGTMASIGLLTGFALAALFLYGFYNVFRTLS